MNRPDGWYPSGMGKIVTLNLDDALIADFERAAADHGQSLEAELRQALDAVRPKRRATREELIALSEGLRAQTPDAAAAIDSTPYIRWMRDTNCGRLPDSPPFDDDEAGY